MNEKVSNDIVLLGNGTIPTDQSAWVDQSAFVIRFNIPRHGGAQNGRRCDALCVTNHGVPARRFAKYRKLKDLPFVYPETEIWIPRPIKNPSLSCHFNNPFQRVRWQQDHSAHIIRRNGWQKQIQVFFSDHIWREAFLKLSLDQTQWQVSPSTGFLALTYCLQRFHPDRFNIHLLGFSFQGSDAHPWKLERKAVERMAANQEVFWPETSVMQKESRELLQFG